MLIIYTRLLADPVKCRDETWLQYCDRLIRIFLLLTNKIFGMAFVAHNFHGLLHTATDVRKFGSIERI